MDDLRKGLIALAVGWAVLDILKYTAMYLIDRHFDKKGPHA